MRELEIGYLADRPRVSKDDLPSDPDWQFVAAGVEARRQEALAEMRGRNVDSADDL